MREFKEEYPEMEQEWYGTSNHICFLAVPSEQDLLELVVDAESVGIRFSEFREDDLDFALTAVAFEPTLESRKMLSQLPLALK